MGFVVKLSKSVVQQDEQISALIINITYIRQPLAHGDSNNRCLTFSRGT